MDDYGLANAVFGLPQSASYLFSSEPDMNTYRSAMLACIKEIATCPLEEVDSVNFRYLTYLIPYSIHDEHDSQNLDRQYQAAFQRRVK